jgi:TRAP-type uncharacterized transport system fused permease subunit
VAVTAFAGAQIAGANPMTTGWQAFRIGFAGFLAPFLFVYQPPLLMRGTWTDIAVASVSAAVGIAGLAAAVAGHMFAPLSWPKRAFLVAVSLAAISPSIAVSLASSAALVVFGAWDASRARLTPVRA